MILVDDALRARAEAGKPVRVGLIGAGFMAQGLTNTVANSVPGMRVVAISNRHLERAQHVYRYSGLEPHEARTQDEMDALIEAGRAAVTEARKVDLPALGRPTRPASAISFSRSQIVFSSPSSPGLARRGARLVDDLK